MTEFQFVGIDVAKDKFDVSIKVGGRYKNEVFSQDKKGHASFLKWLKSTTSIPWVGMEATGHYSELLAEFLAAQQVQVSVVNPLQVKHFMKAKLARNKNDQVDARYISEFCQLMQPPVYEVKSPEQKELRELTKLLSAIKGQITQLKNQLHSTQSKTVEKTLNKLIKQLDAEVEAIEKKLAEIVNSQQQLKESLVLITSIKGIGNLTAYHILARMPDIKYFKSPKQFAAFIGISPKQHQSGLMQGRTTLSKLGSARLRKAFYMSALSAKRHNKALQPFVNQLKNAGKKPKAILGAVMRKLAHYVFAVLKNKQPFCENYSCF